MRLLLLLATTCCGEALSVAGHRWLPAGMRVHKSNAPRLCTNSPTPEELLLEAVGLMKKNEMEKARAAVSDAQQLCDANGGTTEEQAALLQLLLSRLPPLLEVEEKPPSLAEMYPGTSRAPQTQELLRNPWEAQGTLRKKLLRIFQNAVRNLPESCQQTTPISQHLSGVKLPIARRWR